LKSDAWSVTIDAFQPVPVEGQVTLDLTVERNPDDAELPLGLLLEQQVEVLDARGRPMTVLPVEIEGEPPRQHVRLAVYPADDPSKPSAIRLHELVRTTHDLEFRFVDVPLP
jgi:hypothetical protein